MTQVHCLTAGMGAFHGILKGVDWGIEAGSKGHWVHRCCSNMAYECIIMLAYERWQAQKACKLAPNQT